MNQLSWYCSKARVDLYFLQMDTFHSHTHTHTVKSNQNSPNKGYCSDPFPPLIVSIFFISEQTFSMVGVFYYIRFKLFHLIDIVRQSIDTEQKYPVKQYNDDDKSLGMCCYSFCTKSSVSRGCPKHLGRSMA